MGSSRLPIGLATACACLALVVGACASDADVSTNLGIGGAGDQVVPGGAGAQGSEDDGLRAMTSPADESDTTPETTLRPSPPTLSEEGQQSQSTTTTAPPTTPPASVTTAVPTITEPPPDSGADDPEGPDTSDSTVVDSSSSSSSSSSTLVVDPDELALGEARSAELLGQLRVSLSLVELDRVAEMDAFARDWSQQMAQSGSLVHSNGPYGENIAFTSDTSLTAAEAADLFHQLWMGSPGHHENMVGEGYRTLGVGLYLSEQGWYGTHVFGFG